MESDAIEFWELLLLYISLILVLRERIALSMGLVLPLNLCCIHSYGRKKGKLVSPKGAYQSESIDFNHNSKVYWNFV